MQIVFDPSPLQAAALEAACALHNANNGTALDPAGFAQQELGKQLDGYAATLRVGLVPPYEFAERFQRLGVYDRIFALSATDKNVAGYLGILRSKRDDVNVFSPTVAAGLGYLQQLGALTAEQATWICSLEVPAPAETMPVRPSQGPTSPAETP